MRRACIDWVLLLESVTGQDIAWCVQNTHMQTTHGYKSCNTQISPSFTHADMVHTHIFGNTATCLTLLSFTDKKIIKRGPPSLPPGGKDLLLRTTCTRQRVLLPTPSLLLEQRSSARIIELTESDEGQSHVQGRLEKLVFRPSLLILASPPCRVAHRRWGFWAEKQPQQQYQRSTSKPLLRSQHLICL